MIFTITTKYSHLHVCIYVCIVTICIELIQCCVLSSIVLSIYIDSLTDSGMWLDAVTQNAWDTGMYTVIILASVSGQ